MQIQISDKRNAPFPVKVASTNSSALYGIGANMSCMSLAFYTKLKDASPLQNMQALSLHSTTGHDLNPLGINT